MSLAFAPYRSIFRIAPFRRFWVGFALSSVGDALTRVALTWYAWETTHDPRVLGWLSLFYTGPVVLGGLLAGWLLDRFDRRVVMLLDALVRGLSVLAVPLLYFSGHLELWHIYAVASVYGFLMMVSLAGGPSLVPSLVGEEHLNTANALETIGYTLSSVIGPPLAGLLIARIDAPSLLVVDAFTYFFFALSLARLGVSLPPTGTGAGAGLDLGGALTLLRRQPVLWSTTLMFFFFNLGFGTTNVWLPVFVDESLGGGSALFGTLLGALAAGEVASSVLAGGLRLKVTLGRAIILGQTLAGAALVLMLLRPNAWLAGVSLALFGLLSAPLTIWAQTLRMKIIPPELRGRTFALLRMMMMSAMPLGGAAAGLLLPLVGMWAMMAGTAALVGVPGLLGGRLRALREAD